MTNAIYTTLVGLAPGGVLALPAAAFGPGALNDAIAANCDTGVLRASGVTITPTATGATLTGLGTSAPFAGLELSATFVPDGPSAGMNLVGTASAAWDLATGWPILTNTLGESLGLTGATLTLGTGAPGSTTTGLVFRGSAALGPLTPWADLAWLFAELTSVALAGPITVKSGVPEWSWTAVITAPVNVPGLGQLEPTLTFACAAVANDSGPAFGPQLSMHLGATVPLGPGIPVDVDVSNPTGVIPVQANPSAITTDVLSTLGDFVGTELGSFLPSGAGFDPSTIVTLKDVGFMVSPAQKSVSSAWFDLGTPTGTTWPIASGIELASIDLMVVVPFAGSGGEYASPFVTVTGTFALPGGGLAIGGAYANQFSLTADLTPGSTVKITDLLNTFLPTPIDADLELDALDMTVVPSTGAWSLMSDMTGDWGFDIGVVRVALTEAGVSLDHDPAQTTPTTGTIMTTATIGTATSPFTFSGTWTLPETFVLSGDFPDTNVADLVTTITGNPPPDGAPAVDLTATVATIVLDPQASTYDFSLTSTAQTSSGVTLGTAALDVREDKSGFGFLIGFDLPVAWSPAELWAPLGTLFGGLTIKESGLVISTLSDTSTTLPTLKMPSVPATVGPGVTFFTSLALAGGGLDDLAKLFPEGTELDLLAIIDTATPANSTITAELTEPASTNALQIKDLKLTIQPATTKITAVIDAAITVGSGDWAETVTISGGGSLRIEPEPDISLFVDITNWHEPFGIQNLVVNDFGLRVNLIETGLDIGLAGEVTIGQGTDIFSLTLGLGFEDFEVPDWFVFNLQSQSGKTLMLPSLVAAFVPALDLSKVPVVNAIGFEELEFYLVEDPSGITIGDYTYPQGIGLACDVTLYSWELTLSVEVNSSKGIKAAGSVNDVINLFDVLKISDATGTTGPSAAIDTSKLMSNPAAINSPVKTRALAVAPAPGAAPPPYLWLDGEIDLLGVSDTIQASVTDTSFEFEFEFEFLTLVTEKIQCSLEDDKNFSGSASFAFDLDFSIGPWIWESENIELMPRVTISGPQGSVGLSLTINPTVIFDLGFAFSFTWHEINVSVAPHLTAAELENDLENLWDAVVSWMESNLDTVWADLKNDVGKWIAAIEDGLFAITEDIDDIAKALVNYFDASLEEAADALRAIGYEFEESVEALVTWFGATVEEAVEALGEVIDDCAMSTANAALLPGVPVSARPRASTATLVAANVEPVVFPLTRTPQGQRLLLLWYAHQDELTQLAGGTPEARAASTNLAAAGAPATDDGPDASVDGPTVAGGIELLVAVRAGASPDLAEAIDEILPVLEGRADLTLVAFAESLGA
mgnify:FL=1